MMTKRLSVERVVAVLKQAELGMPVTDGIRHYSAAQLRGLRAALERIRVEPTVGANKTLRALAEEAREARARALAAENSTKLHPGPEGRKRA